MKASGGILCIFLVDGCEESVGKGWREGTRIGLGWGGVERGVERGAWEIIQGFKGLEVNIIIAHILVGYKSISRTTLVLKCEATPEPTYPEPIQMLVTHSMG